MKDSFKARTTLTCGISYFEMARISDVKYS
jgi:hypothetical protein